MISSALLAAIHGVLALMITAVPSPLETLSWWAGWTEREAGETEPAAPAPAAPRAPKTYIVYLSGVASISGQFLLPRELFFIRRLRKRLPAATIVSDVFLFAAGMALRRAAPFRPWLWRRAQILNISGRQNSPFSSTCATFAGDGLRRSPLWPDLQSGRRACDRNVLLFS
ncbi:MAG: hypothetical protein R3C58_05690 [Parvularculaceae bacterium]